MTTQTPATAEIEKWLRIRVCFFTNFLLRIRKKTWNPAGVDSGTPYPWPPLVTTGGCQGILDDVIWAYGKFSSGNILVFLINYAKVCIFKEPLIGHLALVVGKLWPKHYNQLINTLLNHQANY